MGVRFMNCHLPIFAGFCAIAALLTAGTIRIHAQDAGPGPMKPPASLALPPPAPETKPEPPPIPPEEMIRRFAAREDEMLRASLNYGFQKSVRLEEFGPDGKETGQVEIVTQQIAGPDGKRYEKVIHRTESTLRFLQMERGDFSIIDSTPLFPLTTPQLSKYDISFQGRQPLDELQTYIFAVKPRSLDRAHAYFSGVVWVDVDDLVIVKTIGKWISELGDVTSPTLPFTTFETFRQQIPFQKATPACPFELPFAGATTPPLPSPRLPEHLRR